MFEYGYRAWDRHKKEVSSLVILGDGSPGFRPSSFGWNRWGSELSYRLMLDASRVEDVFG